MNQFLKNEIKENEGSGVVDLRGVKLRKKELLKMRDIKLRVLKKGQRAPKAWVGRQKTYPHLWCFFKAPQRLLRTVAVLLIIGLNWTAFAAVGTTIAIFHDEEVVGGTLSAGSIEFSLTVTPFDTIRAALNLESGTSTSKSVEVLPSGESNLFQYYASSTAFAGDEHFCDALLVNVSVEGTEIFSGQLGDLITDTTTLIPPGGTGEAWEFTFTTATDHPNSVCHFDIDFNGWQTRNDLPNYEEGGYKDTETISNSIYSNGFRIQKVYFGQEEGATIVTGDATANASVVNIVNTNITDITCECDCEGECDDSCGDVVVVNDNDATVINNVTASASTGGNSADGGDGTIVRRGWVEIYNQTNVALDLGGWRICDDIACDTIPSDIASIPAHGFAVVTEDETLWHEWNIPDNVVLITLSDGTIGGGLNHSADMLLIKRPDEVVIDQMNWGVPSYAWLHYNGDVWNPGISVSTSTEILAREPLGYDTNQPEDFVELGLPVVDLTYPDEDDDSNVWYWGYAYTITWNAFNQNGGDEELLVDIYAIFDENGNGYLDEGDTTQAIALGTENDGAHEWTVPEGFIGTIWIQVVARGPENPMLFSGTISGDIWDPIPEVLAESYKDEYFAQQLGFKGFRAGVAPVQAPVQIIQDVQGLPLDINDVVDKELSFDEEDPEKVVEDEGVSADETGEVDALSEFAEEETLLDDDSLVDEATNPPLTDGQATDPPLADGQDADPEEDAMPASAEGSGVVKEETQTNPEKNTDDE